MIYVAFTLGLFGSIHCVGMCGPLAFSLLPGINERSLHAVKKAVGYNFGRVFSYSTLGFITGMFGGALNFSGLQKPLGIAVGVFLILLFLFSLDIEKFLFKSPIYSKFFSNYSSFFSNQFKGLIRQNSFFIGILNGFIPCGLVYLALAGALSSGNAFKGAQFMMFFGLGTFPAMFALLTSVSFLDFKRKIQFKRILSVLQLFVGIFIIYRAINTNIPLDLSLIQSMINPTMCF